MLSCFLPKYAVTNHFAYGTRALKLVTLLKGVRAFTNIHVEQPILDDLVCENGRVVVVGDAAHGMAVSSKGIRNVVETLVYK